MTVVSLMLGPCCLMLGPLLATLGYAIQTPRSFDNKRRGDLRQLAPRKKLIKNRQAFLSFYRNLAHSGREVFRCVPSMFDS
jgi:hypothetical protein